jgi:hypothetical protein
MPIAVTAVATPIATEIWSPGSLTDISSVRAIVFLIGFCIEGEGVLCHKSLAGGGPKKFFAPGFGRGCGCGWVGLKGLISQQKKKYDRRWPCPSSPPPLNMGVNQTSIKQSTLPRGKSIKVQEERSAK